MTSVIDGGDIIESLSERVLGRIVAKDVVDPSYR
jgi:DNA-directed RNA polymerase subunit beta'